MKHTLLLSGLILILLPACSLLHRMPESTPASAKEDPQILITEHFRKPDIPEPQSTQIIVNPSLSNGTTDHVPSASHPHSRITQDVPEFTNDDTLYVEPKDTVYTDDMLVEAEKSDRDSEKALAFSIVALIGLLLFPLYIIGIAVSIYYLLRYKKYTYVTEEGLRRIKRAKILLLISVLLPFVLLGLVIILLIYFM